MKIGAIIIHSSKFTQRKTVVDNLLQFFNETEVEVNVIEGVFTDEMYYDARKNVYGQKKTKGQIGCALAHLNALELAKIKNYDAVFIFEDDIKIKVKDYNTLKLWIDSIEQPFDILLLAYSNSWTGEFPDGRTHYRKYINDKLIQGSALVGTMAYYIPRKSIDQLYRIQKECANKKVLYNSDGLHVHGTKEDGNYFTLVGPKEKYSLFSHYDSWQSIISSVNK
jgi:GR25 family glycosyltransferase involved in LPS biosynthesis